MPSIATPAWAGSGKATGLGLPSPGNWPATRNSMRNARLSVREILAAGERSDVSQTLQLAVNGRQPLGRHQDVHVHGGSDEPMRTQGHAPGNSVRDPQPIQRGGDLPQRLVNRIVAHKEPAHGRHGVYVRATQPLVVRLRHC